MSFITYVNYVIVFNDEAEYNFAVGLSGGNILLAVAPRDAATMFGIPHPYPGGDLDTIPKTIYFYHPGTPGLEVQFPGPSGVFYDDTVPSFLVPGQAGNPPSIWPAGDDCIFTWVGIITLRNGTANATNPPATAIPQRRWIHGFDVIPQYEIALGTPLASISRDSSRVQGGFGLSIRGQNGATSIIRTVNQLRPGLVTPNSWERFYVRVRRLPDVLRPMGFWNADSATGTAMFGIGVKDDGRFWIIERVTGNSTYIFVQDFATVVLDEFVRFDVFTRFDSGGTNPGRARIYMNGTLVLSYNGTLNQGLRASNNHVRSTMGYYGGLIDQFWEVDIDDWMNADLPSTVDPISLAWLGDPPIDFLVGSHIRTLESDPLTATAVNWTGGIGAINQMIASDAALSSTFVSTVSQAIIEGITDAPLKSIQDTPYMNLGAVAAIVIDRSLNAATTDGALGYKLQAGAAVLGTIDQIASIRTGNFGYLPTGLFLPDEIAPFHIIHRKSADVNSDTTRSLQATAEYIGAWGLEDDPNAATFNSHYHHNARYPNTLFAYYLPNIATPVYIKSGTYAGNSNYQEINLPSLCHWMFIRATSGAGTNGIFFIGSSMAPHLGVQDRVLPEVRVFVDSAGQCKFSVTGNNANSNLTGVTYQYIAFCDPGMRFNLCGVISHPASGDPTYLDSLIDPAFLAEAGFIQNENPAVSSVNGLFYKGPGMITNQGKNFGTGALLSFGQFSAGFLEIATNVIIGNNQSIYSLWRSAEPNCGGIMSQIFSYVGDGSSPKVINISPVSGRVPVFVLVVPSNAGTTVFRDPSHTGANSGNINSTVANFANGIVAVGVDQITVGSGLNTNGITYDVFCLPGDVSGMVNGEYYNPMCEPPTGNRPTPGTIETGGINIIGDGGLILGNSDVPMTLLKDVSGIYTIVKDKRHDTLLDRQPGQPTLDVAIPEPHAKTGFIGG